MQDALAVILAGGMGSRLSPLTDDRAKPAVPFGGKYRIIDFTLTNCLHSGYYARYWFSLNTNHIHYRNTCEMVGPSLIPNLVST